MGQYDVDIEKETLVMLSRRHEDASLISTPLQETYELFTLLGYRPVIEEYELDAPDGSVLDENKVLAPPGMEWEAEAMAVITLLHLTAEGQRQALSLVAVVQEPLTMQNIANALFDARDNKEISELENIAIGLLAAGYDQDHDVNA